MVASSQGAFRANASQQRAVQNSILSGRSVNRKELASLLEGQDAAKRCVAMRTKRQRSSGLDCCLSALPLPLLAQADALGSRCRVAGYDHWEMVRQLPSLAVLLRLVPGVVR